MLCTYPATVLFSLAYVAAAASEQCRCTPNDPCWPSAQEWQAFNATLDGRLIKTVPLGHVCHDPTYDEQACLDLRQRWMASATHLESSHSLMVPVYANDSCSPWTERDSLCEIGAYVQYAVNVSSVEHVTKTIDFVRDSNIRLVIRNTGHDYLGKSSGPFSVALWMHHLTSLSVLSWSDKIYQGPAIRIAAGVQGSDLIAFAAQHNLTALTGTCPTVGVAGGYVQGGGHSTLSSKYGLAADQLLEMEIVDAGGVAKTINREANGDLFWALSGGGGGTFAVVLSVTVRAYRDLPSSTVALEFEVGHLAEENEYLEGISFFQSLLPSIHDAGCATIYTFTRQDFQGSLVCHGKSSTETLALLQPCLAKIRSLRLSYRRTSTDYAKWSDGAREGWIGRDLYIVNNIQAATWLIPRANILDAGKNAQIVQAVLKMQDMGATVGVQSFSPSRAVAAAIDNAVFPRWRSAALLVWVILPTNDSYPMVKLLEDQARLSTELLPVIQAVAPDGGTYLNEADPIDVHWKGNNFGPNYERLLAVKKEYDAEGLFYARHAVGSDDWVEDHDGRLCRAAQDGPQAVDEL